MKYEENIREMEEIVRKMSDEAISVEEGLKLYERGILLAKESLAELNSYKGKMEILNKNLAELVAETECEDDDDNE